MSIREDSGIIYRCLSVEECSETGMRYSRAQDGNMDVRLRLVLDNGKSTISLIVNKSATESLLGMSQADISSNVSENGSMQFIQDLRERLLEENYLLKAELL